MKLVYFSLRMTIVSLFLITGLMYIGKPALDSKGSSRICIVKTLFKCKTLLRRDYILFLSLCLSAVKTIWLQIIVLMTLTTISSNIFFRINGLLYNVGSLFGMSLSKKMVAFMSLEGHLLKALVGLPGSNL